MILGEHLRGPGEGKREKQPSFFTKVLFFCLFCQKAGLSDANRELKINQFRLERKV